MYLIAEDALDGVHQRILAVARQGAVHDGPDVQELVAEQPVTQ